MCQNLWPDAEFSLLCPKYVYVSWSINSAKYHHAEFALIVQIFQNPLSALFFGFFNIFNCL